MPDKPKYQNIPIPIETHEKAKIRAIQEHRKLWEIVDDALLGYLSKPFKKGKNKKARKEGG